MKKFDLEDFVLKISARVDNYVCTVWPEAWLKPSSFKCWNMHDNGHLGIEELQKVLYIHHERF